MIFTILTDQEKQLPFYVTGIGVQANQEHVVRTYGFPSFQWTYCTKGSGVFKIGGKEYQIGAGTGFLFSPDIPHEYYACEEPWETCWLTFCGGTVLSLFRLLNIGAWDVFSPDDGAAILRLFRGIEAELAQADFGKILTTSALLYTFLLKLKDFRHVTDVPQVNNRMMKLKPVISYMEANYQQYITLDELASLVGVTTHHFCKLFRAAFSVTPFEYLIQLRLQAAKQFLVQNPELKIKEICRRVCYSDVSYFCAIFKKQEAMTPLEFRRLHGIS